ncbi:MAG TPA: MaoC/PaaZ C-terminal domain-containing protein [Solirubrobacterales bacterium]
MSEDRVLTYRKTVTEADVGLFAGVTGDFSPIHVDAQYAAEQPIKERLAHGVLILGLMSAAAARWCEREGVDALSYGYERVRFIRPVRLGETVTVSYRFLREESETGKIFAAVEAHRQDGTLVGATEHILWRMGSEHEVAG